MGVESLDHVLAVAGGVSGVVAGLIVGGFKVLERVIGKMKFDVSASETMQLNQDVLKQTNDMIQQFRSSVEATSEHSERVFEKLLEYAEEQARNSAEIATLLKAYLMQRGN